MHTLESMRRAAAQGLAGPPDWIERVIARAVKDQVSLWHAASLIDGKPCACTPCSRGEVSE